MSGGPGSWAAAAIPTRYVDPRVHRSAGVKMGATQLCAWRPAAATTTAVGLAFALQTLGVHDAGADLYIALGSVFVLLGWLLVPGLVATFDLPVGGVVWSVLASASLGTIVGRGRVPTSSSYSPGQAGSSQVSCFVPRRLSSRGGSIRPGSAAAWEARREAGSRASVRGRDGRTPRPSRCRHVMRGR